MEAAASKKVVLHIADHAFDLALGARTVRTMGFEAMVVGKVAEAWIDEPGPDDDLTHVVIEDLGRPASEVGKSVLMAANQALQTHGAGELNVESPREAQHHDKKEHTNRAAIGQLIAAGFSPVRLGQLAGRRLESNGQMRRAAQTQGGQETADNAFGALETHFADLLGQTHPGEAVLLESLPEIILERIEF
jgi:hypothetical protein